MTDDDLRYFWPALAIVLTAVVLLGLTQHWVGL